jgi:two-component system response regulator YesN
VGGVYDSLMDVSRSYREAKHTLHFSLRQHRRGTLWVDDLPQESDSHYYPGDIETRLVNHAKAGDLQEVRLLLDDIYLRNFVERNLSPSIQRLLIYDMTGSLMKIQEQLTLGTTNNIKSLLAGADDSDDLVDVFRIVADIYMEISIQAHDRKKSQNVRLLENILQYIHASYQNPDLNLDAAADRMSISKVYLSQFFKEQTGTNFSDYLETLRMEKACAMLAQTSITVNEIAQQTGYNSANTFCRAFKRINGISAVSFRNSARIS